MSGKQSVARIERFEEPCEITAKDPAGSILLDGSKPRWRMVIASIFESHGETRTDVLDGWQDNWDLVAVLHSLSEIGWRCVGGDGRTTALIVRDER